MAGLKKKKKEKSTSPNVVLVVFLVFFILVSIGLGVWGYYGYAGQEELRTAKNSAVVALKSEKTTRDYYYMLYGDLRQVRGDKLDQDEETALNGYRDEFIKADFGTFKAEKNKEAARKLMDDNRTLLGTAEDGKSYKLDLKTKLETAELEAKDAKGKLAASVAKNTRMEDLVANMTKNQTKFQQDIVARINKGNTEAIAAYQKPTKEFEELVAQLATRDKLLEEAKEEKLALSADHEKQVKALNRKYVLLEAKVKEDLAAAGSGGAPVGMNSAGSVAPLLLDLAKGKPLWDTPVGKVLRVEPDQRTVTINVGSSQGAKAELTFNIFGVNSSGRAEGQLKGSIEIIKVVDSSSSIARVTSLYDVDGREIALNDPGRLRIARETESGIREGDLLFNLFWGAHVAVTGYVSITGERSDNPAEQNRQTEDFIYLLKQNGMLVDAFVDLRDGQIRGNLSTRTRYLIIGGDLRAEPGAKPAGEDEPAAPNAGRNDTINKANTLLRNDAVSKGLLLISAENFATVIGYRQARNANNPQVSSFTPRLPFAGSGVGGVMDGAPKKDADMPKKDADMPKKDGDMPKKDAEDKKDN